MLTPWTRTVAADEAELRGEQRGSGDGQPERRWPTNRQCPEWSGCRAGRSTSPSWGWQSWLNYGRLQQPRSDMREQPISGA